MEKICVAIRVRPPISGSQEIENGETYWKVEDNRISLHKSHGTPIAGISYAFDRIFDESCTNASVYELLTRDIIHAAVDGFNGTAFAYGQTSSGKTFTMNGSETDPGIIRRAVKDVFNRIDMITDREFLIRVSYMEIYNEEINDLLTVENQKLQIHESLERGIFVAGLREEIVNNSEQVLKLIESGEVNRHFGETNMNSRSSRSHTIFRMVIESKGKDTNSADDYSSGDAIRVSVLNLVDLAGSERIAKTGAGGVRLKEGKHINKSLMILGNVINKLSEGVKQRGHIPYRDSKLTRILQPALGGNAKTSIICTIAPEEVHVEESKGTLQFASRAKRITNCVQVNEILTDAALLKRQKLEIEELRKKLHVRTELCMILLNAMKQLYNRENLLQGSRSEVLEQEILKLRNEMLKYELEREKLETELEEQRKSHKERDQCIKEQQMKIDNLNNLVTSSDSDRTSNQGQNFGRQSVKEENNGSNSINQEDFFRTPTFKAAPNSFVVKRSNYSSLPDCSPLPDTLSNVADEDTWMKMNKGYVADLDSIEMTPARKVQSFPHNDVTPGYSGDNYRKELENLRRKLELVTKEKTELELKHSEQVILNDRLMMEISELKQETQLFEELPKKLCESIADCKDMYKDVLLMLQRSVPHGESLIVKLLSGTSEIGLSIFSNLETNFSMTWDGHDSVPRDDSTVKQRCTMLSESLVGTIESLVLSETSTTQVKEKDAIYSRECKDCMERETASWKEKLVSELDTFQVKCNSLQKELENNQQLLGESRERYSVLERDFRLLKEERDTLFQRVSDSSHKVALANDQKENALKDLNNEALSRKDLEDKIKQFTVAFSGRHRSLISFQKELKCQVETLSAKSSFSVSK
ncbi:hypothetical protein K2173_028428 [Erythroxylum novogranatense]|uniref:Kinesin-like protein n=1 Tax=Erythroxylum novogranatense TaxID=1862640 RepID=A0AAV8U354_9ROSI|nr:hypothetical protein K2173_028428 [Erythroxylum novogranatense]